MANPTWRSRMAWRTPAPFSAPQYHRPLHGAEPEGKDAAGRDEGGRARQLPPWQDPPRLLEDRQDRPSDLADAQARQGASEGREGQPRRQPRTYALTASVVFNPSLSV